MDIGLSNDPRETMRVVFLKAEFNNKAMKDVDKKMKDVDKEKDAYNERQDDLCSLWFFLPQCNGSDKLILSLFLFFIRSFLVDFKILILHLEKMYS